MCLNVEKRNPAKLTNAQQEVLTRDDLIRLLGPRPFEEKDQEFSKYFGSRGDREGAPEPKPGESAGPDGGIGGGGGGPAGGPMPGGIGGGMPAAFGKPQE